MSSAVGLRDAAGRLATVEGGAGLGRILNGAAEEASRPECATHRGASAIRITRASPSRTRRDSKPDQERSLKRSPSDPAGSSRMVTSHCPHQESCGHLAAPSPSLQSSPQSCQPGFPRPGLVAILLPSSAAAAPRFSNAHLHRRRRSTKPGSCGERQLTFLMVARCASGQSAVSYPAILFVSAPTAGGLPQSVDPSGRWESSGAPSPLGRVS
jgi:hypothetical protein